MAFGFTETRIWVDVSVSSSIHALHRFQELARDATVVLRHVQFVGPFSIAEKLRTEPQPLFPGDVETSPRHVSEAISVGECSAIELKSLLRAFAKQG